MRGLVHSDLHLGNVLEHHGQARPLDFDDAAWGHDAMDLAITVDSVPEPPHPVPLDGYQAVQSLPEGYEEHAEALLAGRRLFLATFLLAAGLPAAAHLDLLRAFAES
jgi:Ser/Thr protein kinase RdoA (MazF antagonist)